MGRWDKFKKPTKSDKEIEEVEAKEIEVKTEDPAENQLDIPETADQVATVEMIFRCKKCSKCSVSRSNFKEVDCQYCDKGIAEPFLIQSGETFVAVKK